MKKKNQQGFGLVEVTVVLVLLYLLSIFFIFKIGQITDRAKATKIVENFSAIEKALLLLMEDQENNRWWGEEEFPNNGKIESIESLKKYLKTTPKPPIGSGYYYDNDGDTQTSEGNIDKGVNILLLFEHFLDSDIRKFFDIVDEKIDNGDGPERGRLRADSQSIIYNLSFDEKHY